MIVEERFWGKTSPTEVFTSLLVAAWLCCVAQRTVMMNYIKLNTDWMYIKRYML